MAYGITDSCNVGLPLASRSARTDCIHPEQDEPEFEAAPQM